jgi:hypothetical protein
MKNTMGASGVTGITKKEMNPKAKEILEDILNK